MSPEPFSYTHRVTYSDCTLGNHVYYGRYLEWLEAARAEFFRARGASFLELQKQDTIFPVIECHLQYKSAARYDDLVSLSVWVCKIERIRLSFAYRVTHTSGRVILEAETLHVCTSISEKPKRIPEDLLALLKPS
jgi:acyl-CoA thioester hydrolase